MRFAIDLRETALHIKGLMLLQHMVASTRELVRERLARNDRVGVGLLALVEALGFRAIAAREMGRLDERPREIAIAILHVALALLLAVGDALAIHATRVRRKVAHVRK